MATLKTEAFDVSADRFGDPQTVGGQQGDQGLVPGAGQAGGDEEGADLGAVQTHGVRVVVEPGPADMDRWGLLEGAFFDGVAVKAAHGAQPPGDCGPSPTEECRSPAG